MIIQRNTSIPLYIQVYTYYKTQILTKKMKAYTKLPSVRSAIKKYHISKTTVEKAYQQLQIEGYIQSQPKSGYYVLPIQTLNKTTHKKEIAVSNPYHYKNISQTEDSFDITPLRRAYQTVLQADNSDLFTPPLPEGEVNLRKAILHHLETERGVIAHVSQVTIASGIQNHLMALANITSKRKVAYLVPLFDRASLAFDTLGFEKIPCETIDDLIASTPDFIYISPGNLYPSGDVLSINHRLALISYAKKHDAMIIEDDYNHIFRYNAFQIPSIQGLSKGNNVIYIGSFARNTLLSLRISYMVLPNQLTQLYYEKDKLAQTVSKIDQFAFAHYINDGAYQKHLKKLSRSSKKQNDTIIRLLETLEIPDSITVSGLDSNLHILIHTPDKSVYKDIIAHANQSDLYVKTFEELDGVIVFPYSGLDEQALESSLISLFNNIPNFC